MLSLLSSADGVGPTVQAEARASAEVVTPDAGYPPARRAWWTVGVLSVLYALSLLDRQIIALLVPDIRRDLGINDFDVGLLQAVVFSLFYVTFGLLFGWLAARFSRRGMIFGGVGEAWSGQGRAPAPATSVGA